MNNFQRLLAVAFLVFLTLSTYEAAKKFVSGIARSNVSTYDYPYHEVCSGSG